MRAILPLLPGFIAVTAAAADPTWSLPDPAKAVHPAAAVAAADPTGYPDPQGFADRSRLVIDGLAHEDLAQWRRGWFTGGDPGKYLPLAAMARLIRDPADAMARQYLNDERSPTEHYHFAAVNWSRLLPLFGAALSAETRARFSAGAATTTAYLDGKGTENHKTMWCTSSLVLPRFTAGDSFGGRPKPEVAERQKRWLRDYVKTIFAVGQGEWDSSTYLMFDINGMLNIYDFSDDPECRLIAAAALDWLVAAYALKYTDGCYCAPNQRGFAPEAVHTIADQTGWLWWGASRPVDAAAAAGFRYAMHPITSSWRPNRVLCNIARKQLTPLPADCRGSKPNYWFGQAIPPLANRWQESLHLDRDFTLGCLWSGNGGQTTRLELVARGEHGATCFTGGSPIGRNDGNGAIQRGHHGDGNGLYDRTAQIGAALLCISRIPEDEPEAFAYAFVTIPPGIDPPQQRGSWWIMRAGGTWVGVRGLGGPGAIAAGTPDPEKKNAPAPPILRFPGHRTGFILQAASASATTDLEAFAGALAACTVDDSRFASEQAVTYRSLAGTAISLAYRPEAESAAVACDGTPVSLADWPLASGPFVSRQPGVLQVSDGREGYRIDFTGDLPVYGAWVPGKP